MRFVDTKHIRLPASAMQIAWVEMSPKGKPHSTFWRLNASSIISKHWPNAKMMVSGYTELNQNTINNECASTVFYMYIFCTSWEGLGQGCLDFFPFVITAPFWFGFLCFWDKVSCSTGWPQTCCSDPANHCLASAGLLEVTRILGFKLQGSCMLDKHYQPFSPKK